MTVATQSPRLPLASPPGEVMDAPQRLEPDLEIRVRLDSQKLHFEVTARNPDLKLQEKELGSTSFSEEPQSYFERFYDRLSYLDGNGQKGLESLCVELARELLPADLHQLLWRRKGLAETLWIRSDEVWIPWEILKLCGEEGDRRVSGPFLCEAFRITRWRTRVPFRRELPVRRLAAVLGQFSDLEALSDERSFLEELRDEAIEIAFPSDRQEILAAMDKQLFDAWHFASHGKWHGGDPAGAEIPLGSSDSSETIHLRDLECEAPNFCKNHPLVFLNVCHLGRGERGLVHWGGWTARLVELEVGAVLGALWPIDDQAAARFVRSFYGAFVAGAPLAEAVQQARLDTRKAFPEEATWLAFTAFGHPLAVCAEPAETVLSEPHFKKVPEEPSTGHTLPGSGQSGHPVKEIERRRASRASPSRLANRLRWASGALALSLLVFAVLAGVRTDTRIQLDLTATRLAFTAGGDKAVPLTDSGLPFQSLVVARFARMEMQPRELAWFDSQEGWRPARELAGPVSLVAHDPASQMSIESAVSATSPQAAGNPMITDRLWVEPGSRVVVRATSRGQGFDVGFEIVPVESLALSVHSPFALSADFVEIRGLKTEVRRAAGRQTFLRGRLREDRPILEIFPGSQNLVISGTFGSSAEVPLLRRGLPITAFDLFAQDADGELRSTLADDGQLSYPDHPWEPSLTLGAGEFLAVEGLRDFQLRSLDLVRQGGPLRLSLDGVARKIRSGPRRLARDRRLSLYEKWVRGRFVQSFVAWITGWIALALGLEELRRRVVGRA